MCVLRIRKMHIGTKTKYFNAFSLIFLVNDTDTTNLNLSLDSYKVTDELTLILP